MHLPAVIQASELQTQLSQRNDLLLVDLGDNARYLERHLPSAVQLDYAAITHNAKPVMGLLPPAEQLGAVLSQLGLKPGQPVVAYDDAGNGKAARLIYTLHCLGHEQASLLDGGLPAWEAAGLATEAGAVSTTPSHYSAQFADGVALNRDDILQQLDNPQLRLLDTRTAGEFAGADVRAARGGHIPGAKHLDWSDTKAADGRLLPAEQLRAMLAERDIRPEHQVVVYCQTHHRSAHSFVMLKALGYPNVAGYPGAWSDWGNAADTPIE